VEEVAAFIFSGERLSPLVSFVCLPSLPVSTDAATSL
jgi:hypothetical protein